MIHKERDSKNGVNHLDKYQNMTNPVSAIVHSENDLSRIFSSTPIGLFLNNLETKKLISKAFFTLIVFIFFSVKVGIEKDKHNTHD